MGMSTGGGGKGPLSEINVTPLVDVMLVLLIIMMLIAPMLQKGVDVRLPQAGKARIEIYNTQCQLVEVLVDGWRAGGSHLATWNSGNHASGTYFYRFRSGEAASPSGRTRTAPALRKGDERLRLGVALLAGRSFLLRLPGVEPLAVLLAEAAGLDVVENRCMKIEHGRLFGGLHWAGVNTGVISAHGLMDAYLRKARRQAGEDPYETVVRARAPVAVLRVFWRAPLPLRNAPSNPHRSKHFPRS